MRQEFGWSRSAQAYANLYRVLFAAPAEMAIERSVGREKLTA
jgi:glycogen synthase